MDVYDDEFDNMLAGLCDVLHINMTSEGALMASVGAEAARVRANLTQMCLSNVEELVQMLINDIFGDINDTLLPVGACAQRMIHYRNYFYAAVNDSMQTPYIFAACFMY